METKSHNRRKFPMGFTDRKDPEGMKVGHGMVVLPRRNAYQLIGLRRPAKDTTLRIKVV